MYHIHIYVGVHLISCRKPNLRMRLPSLDESQILKIHMIHREVRSIRSKPEPDLVPDQQPPSWVSY